MTRLRRIWFVLAAVLVVVATSCGLAQTSGHFDDLAAQEPVMADYQPNGTTPGTRIETKADGELGLGDSRSAELSQSFRLDHPPATDEERDQLLFDLMRQAAADAEAAGWVMEAPQPTGLQLRGNYASESSVPGGWSLRISTGENSLLLRIFYYDE